MIGHDILRPILQTIDINTPLERYANYSMKYVDGISTSFSFAVKSIRHQSFFGMEMNVRTCSPFTSFKSPNR